MTTNFEEQVGITEAMESDEELITEDEEVEETEENEENEEVEETEADNEGIDAKDVAVAGLFVAGTGAALYAGWKVGCWIKSKIEKGEKKEKPKNGTPLYKRIHFQMPIVIDPKEEPKVIEPEIIDPKNKK